MEDEVTLMKNYVFDDIEIEFIDDIQLYEYVTKDPSECDNNTCNNPTQVLLRENNNDVEKRNEKLVELRCHLCNQTFDSRRKLATHMFAHYSIKFQCQECDKKFANSKDLTEHIKEHGTSEIIGENELATSDKIEKPKFLQILFDCRWCPLKFKTSSALESHVSITHILLSCNKCDATFRSQADIEMHSILHEEISECKTYDLTMDSDEEMQENKSIIQKTRSKETEVLPDKAIQNSGPNTQLCPICGHNFDNLQHLQQHEEEVHFQIRPFACLGCQMSFARVKAFSEHFRARRHMGNSKCNLCQEEFLVSSKLIDHVRDNHCNKIVKL